MVLELHRASAGSGKTYTLAKKYIWYYITISENGGAERLRTVKELEDSAKRILAVTFTNKATNEMQMRIVDRIFDLAYKKPVYELKDDGTRFISSPDYLQEFSDRLGVSPDKVSAVCRRALYILLENYSDFNVSTIDSFFQLVLRTLAYESDLTDSFQVELDSDYVSKVSVDATLEDIDSSAADGSVQYWISNLMNRNISKIKSWNIFSRQVPSKKNPNDETAYFSLIKSIKKLENEDYKMIRKEVEDYFKRGVDFVALYEGFGKKYDAPVREAFDEMREAYGRAFELLPDEIRNYNNARKDIGKFQSRLGGMANLDDSLFASHKKVMETFSSSLIPFFDKKAVAKEFKPYSDKVPDLIAAITKAEEALQKWYEMVEEKEYQHWRLYSENMPYLALFGEVQARRMDFLDEMNSIELGETNMILRSIIGDTDAPFVYERLGTVLNHFLIDEFQDTSRLQWDNLRPLLAECLTRNDSLIIGDAKQSIYRFRNADPSLITSVVPSEFNHLVKPFGNRPEENTNYRSCLRVIQFNNSFFEYLTQRLDEASAGGEVERMKFGPLYANVVQMPKKRKPDGYVEVSFGRRIGRSSTYNAYVKQRIPELVAELIGRGYAQKEIAVLVNTNDQGEEIIRRFIDYNSTCEDPAKQIRFISEQSLKVAQSRAVKLIEGVLENMARGFDPEINPKEDRNKKGTTRWADIKANFKFFAMNREGKSMADLLDEYIDAQPDMSAITDVLSSMQSLAIPAIVEAVVANFIPEDMRRDDAVFIAAFQDLVLEYCERNPTDIGSFLNWWERRKDKVSITSPAETDAVQVMTIHKSKGLEFSCVILPFTNDNFADAAPSAGKGEWRWVEPEQLEHPDSTMEMPPYMPVETSPALVGTEHAHIYYDYLDKVKMDRLNSAYVAFTRAKRELYIFADGDSEIKGEVDLSQKSGYARIARYLFEYMNGLGADNADDISRINKAELDGGPEGESERFIFTYGEKVEDIVAYRKQEELEEKLRKEEQRKKLGLSAVEEEEEYTCEMNEKPKMHPIEDYVSTMPAINTLKYREEDVIVDVVDDEVEEEDLDPRSEGNIKHAVLELVNRPSDLPKAVRHLMLKGIINRSMCAEIESELAAKLALPEVAPWFDGSARVITERPLLRQGYVSRRPDRIMLYPDGTVVVVDYKFGKFDKSGRHQRQVRRYMQLLADTGSFRAVKGFLWYVNENRIEPVSLKEKKGN